MWPGNNFFYLVLAPKRWLTITIINQSSGATALQGLGRQSGRRRSAKIVSRGQRNGSPRPLISVYRTWIATYFIQVAPQLTSRVHPVPDPLPLRKSGSAGNRTRDLCICSQKLWPLDHRGGMMAHYISKNIASVDLKFRSRSTFHSRYYHCYWNCWISFEVASKNYEQRFQAKAWKCVSWYIWITFVQIANHYYRDRGQLLQWPLCCWQGQWKFLHKSTTAANWYSAVNWHEAFSAFR